jgi:hypothetical protein
MEKSDGSCSWRKNRKFKTCLQRNDEHYPWKKPKSVGIQSVVDDEHSPGFWP